MLQQAWHINNECNPAIAGNSGTGHAWRTLERSPKGLDNHFFLTNQLVDHEPDLLGTHGHNDNMGVIGHLLASAATNQLALDVE